MLARDIASIEAKLAEEDDAVAAGSAVTDDDLDWRRRAEAACKVKKSIRQIVINRRGDMTRAAKQAAADSQTRALLKIVKTRFPEQFEEAVEVHRASLGHETAEVPTHAGL